MTMNRRTFLQTAGAGAGLALAGGSDAFHDRIHNGYSSLQPAPGEIENLRILGYCDMTYNGVPGKVGGWDRTYEFQYRAGFLYCSHQIGWSIVDARDVRNMNVIFRHTNVDPSPDNTQYIDIARGDHIVVQKRNDRLVMWDVTNPFSPVQLSTFTPPGILVTNPGGGVQGSFGYHGLWVHRNSAGRFACASVRLTGYTDQILMIINITDPRNPKEEARWWYPGMWTAGGEVPTWPSDAGLPGRVGTPVQMHDLTTYGDRAYVAWRQKGIIILDFSNMSRPVRIGEINWGDVSRAQFHPIAAATHSIGLVIPEDGGAIQTVIAGDEVGLCPGGYGHVVDVRNERRPQEISDFQLPFNRGGNCPYDRNVSRQAIHDMERYTRGNIVWAVWEEGGFYGWDISDIHRPAVAAYYIAPARSDAGRAGSSHGDDANVDWKRNIQFCSGSDSGAGGITAMRYTPGLRGKVTWDAEERNVIFHKSTDPIITY
jgi:hypothetical protein